ncbi:MAG: hypothetical protein K6F86_09095 [Lachnospiraceae bacterium]|nr:hypothetical protein [Lachnospiraceae bacterium]
MNEYIDCYVAFLDILGFKALQENASCDEIKHIFDELIGFKAHPLLKDRKVYGEVRLYVMSDSVVVYIASQKEDAFIALAEVCLQIQLKLATHNPPILVRGAIEKGPLYCEGNIIFGGGLSKAYVLESTLAKYPRIIFTDAIRKVALQNTGKSFVFDYSQMFYKKDSDMLFYIDYLHTFAFIPSLKVKTIDEITDFDNAFFEKLFEYIEERLGEEKSPSIREKYMWLREKVLMQVEHMPEVKKHFKEIERKDQEEKTKRFDLALDNNAN